MEQVSEIGKSLPEIVLGDGVILEQGGWRTFAVAIKPLLRVAADVQGRWCIYLDAQVCEVWRDGTLLWRRAG